MPFFINCLKKEPPLTQSWICSWFIMIISGELNVCEQYNKLCPAPSICCTLTPLIFNSSFIMFTNG